LGFLSLPARFSEAEFSLLLSPPSAASFSPSLFSAAGYADHDGGGGDGGCAAEKLLLLVEEA
jgi:hypothetical protein